ncbi:hypothetical protein GCM10010278_73030 [Streptomyces melanogenes]|nr:hypothetical protein GCM10010278_73030 [Streptomyces melanogenes]
MSRAGACFLPIYRTIMRGPSAAAVRSPGTAQQGWGVVSALCHRSPPNRVPGGLESALHPHPYDEVVQGVVSGGGVGQ